MSPRAPILLCLHLVYVPECSGRSLEEVNLLFYHKISAWESRKWKPAVPTVVELQGMSGLDPESKLDSEHVEAHEDKRDMV